MVERNETKLPEQLTDDEVKEIEKKCEELKTKHNVSLVYPCVQFKNDGTNERVICYIAEPRFLDKLSLMDKSATLGMFHAANELRELYTLKEESNPLTYGESFECDRYKLGVTRFCLFNLVDTAENQYKKK